MDTFEEEIIEATGVGYKWYLRHTKYDGVPDEQYEGDEDEDVRHCLTHDLNGDKVSVARARSQCKRQPGEVII